MDEQQQALLYDAEAEWALIYRLFLEPRELWTVRDRLPAAAFYLVRNRELFQAFCNLADAGALEEDAPLDYLAVCEELSRMGVEDAARIALQAISEHALPFTSAESGLRIVLGYYNRRRALQAASEIVRGAYAGGDQFAQSIEKAQALLTPVSTVRAPPDLSETVASLSAKIAYRLEHPLRPGEMPGISTGLLDLDQLLGGLEPALYVVAGRASLGKTALAMAIALNVAQQQLPVLFFSLEMSKELLVERAVCAMAQVERLALRRGSLVSDQQAQARVAHATQQIAKMPLVIRTDCTRPEAICAAIHHDVASRGCRLVVVDYLSLVDWSGLGDNKHQGLGAVARRLKMVEQATGVPVLLVHQVGRAVDQRAEKRPQLADLYETGNLEQHADVVLMLYREDYYTSDLAHKNLMEIICRKDRPNGRTGHISVYFGPYAEVRNIEARIPPEQAPIPF